jgi:ubiquinone/menaquinone biosynthesis C-methylase UbiE
MDSRASLIRVGAAPMEVTPDSIEGAEKVLEAIEKKDVALAEAAIKFYDTIIPKENLGGDYTAMQWLLRDLVATIRGEKLNYDKRAAAYREFLVGNNYAKLMEYFERQYGLHDFKPTDPAVQKERRSMLEDYIMFMNPRRDEWESSEKCLKLVALQPGEKVLDIGCGMGFYTYKMAAQVGPKGLVYAIDTEEEYIKSLDATISDEKIGNIKTIVSSPTDIKVNDQADVAFICSLYHVIYGWATEPNRRLFLESIKRALKPDGRLVIVDNVAQDGRELHSEYVDHRLVEAQMHFYGFETELFAEISPLRYVLVFKQAAPARPAVLPAIVSQELGTNGAQYIRVTSGNSIVHIGSLDSYDITPLGIEAAKVALEAFTTKSPAATKEAIARYTQLIPDENFGGEFTALQWFCEHLLASPEQKEVMLRDPLNRAYFHYLADDDYGLIKDYIKTKYKLLKTGEKTRVGDDAPPPRPIRRGGTNQPAAPTSATNATVKADARSKAIKPQDEATDPNVGRTRRSFLEDFILFDNPKRPQWEQTDKIMALLDFKKGDKVADIGCGPGYFTFRFSKMVGDEGRVFALDIKQEHLDFLDEFITKQGIKNVTTVKSTEEDLGVKELVDAAYMCSLYHIIYGVVSETARKALVTSILRTLKPHGRFIVVDNGPVADTQLPYHGPYLTKELTILQLEHYGFKFVSYHQIIPQRYMLVFEKP